MHRMQTRYSAPGRMGQLKLFIASLWLTLATALFCAVLPTGLPQSVSHGSAFNPANSIVALHSGAGTNRALLKRIEHKDPSAGTVSGGDIVQPSELATVALPIAAPMPALAPTPATLALLHGWNHRYARGPPVA